MIQKSFAACPASAFLSDVFYHTILFRSCQHLFSFFSNFFSGFISTLSERPFSAAVQTAGMNFGTRSGFKHLRNI